MAVVYILNVVVAITVFALLGLFIEKILDSLIETYTKHDRSNK